jgi:hypothetical protein
MDLERTDNRFGLEQGLQSFANTVVLLPLITLCILSRLPKTERQDAIRVGIRDDNNFIRKTRLFFQDRYYLVVDRAGKFSCLALFANQFNHACKHDALLSFG